MKDFNKKQINNKFNIEFNNKYSNNKLANRIYKMTCDESLKYFNSSLEGLNDKQKNTNQNKYGKNVIEEKRRKTVFEVFIEQYLNILVILLILASILSYFTGGVENTIVIIVVITLNAILGTIEYFKAEKSLKSLKKMSSLYISVIRNNKKTKINFDDVVVGDIVCLKSGDIIPADMRIITFNSLEVDESMLTGESALVEKNNSVLSSETSLGERKNILFRGTKVISGNATGIVYSVGMNTEIGNIAKMMQSVKRKKSPLEKSIDKFSKELAILILTICILVFIMGIYQNISTMDSLMFAISLAVAAIPEALQTIVTIVLAISTEKLAREKAIVKDIKAIETLGCVDVICSDKTGTLTSNKMSVEKFYYQDRIYNNIDINSIFGKGLILCNDSDINNLNNNSINTDEAIIRYIQKTNVDIVNIRQKHQRLFEIPFSSINKMAVTVNLVDRKKIMFVKGGSDKVLGLCDMSFTNKENIKKIINENSLLGYRILALGYKDLTNTNITSNKTLLKHVNNLKFLGLIFLADPIKEGVLESIKLCQDYHTRVIMITGDHALTATSIGSKIGIPSKKYLTGPELEKMTDEELLNKVEEVSIYARVSPSDKIRIVSLLQKNGHKVAFIGDGVNDSPALKKADVGVSMGINGTDVSKDASDVILMDDNIGTINNAIIRGRKVYQNIQNTILFLIAGNIAGIFMVLYTTFLNLPIPFAPVHLLFINLINDSLPAIAIGIEENGLSNREIHYPRNKDNGLLSKRVTKRIILEGLLIAICTIISYYIGLDDIYKARTMVFVTITVARLFYSFNCMGRFSLLYQRKQGYKINKTLIFSLIFGLVLINALLFIPSLRTLFDISLLTDKEILLSYGLGLVPAIMIQMFLMMRDKRRKKRKK